MPVQSEKRYIISSAASRKSRLWVIEPFTLRQLYERCLAVTRTPETFAEYQGKTREERGAIKDVGGFVAGYLRDGRRHKGNVEYRSMLTIDLDNCTEEDVHAVREGLASLDCAYIVYSTHSHCPEAPRLRVIIPLSSPLAPLPFEAVSRAVALSRWPKMCDKTTHQAERLMYWPSASVDAEYVCFAELDRAPLDVDHILESYKDWRDTANWPVAEDEETVKDREDRKAADPRTKPGYIGAFCRAFGISEAIERFLPEVYTAAGKDRYTFVGGSAAGGAVVYDDLWLYSNHSHDPLCARLSNAYDLVRVHLYGNGEDSYAAMKDLCISLPEVQAGGVSDTGAALAAALAATLDLSAFRDPEAHHESGAEEDTSVKMPWDTVPMPPEQWQSVLQRNKKKELKPSVANFLHILRNDEQLWNRIWFNSFTGRVFTRGDLPWRKTTGVKGDEIWQDSDSCNLEAFISHKYGLDSSAKINTALEALMTSRAYHPVRQWLKTLKWDGTSRIATLLHDVLGADDNPLNRSLSRLILIAAVGRVFEPGIKYDICVVLLGPEGCGKSTFIKALAGEDYFSDSLKDFSGKDAMEHLLGKWIIELGEMAAMSRSELEEQKAFLSSTQDTYRAAYARRSSTVRRQCIFVATTNRRLPLRGFTGNRRYPVVEVNPANAKADKWVGDYIAEVRDQLWAEAYHIWVTEHPRLCLDKEMESEARRREAEYNADKQSPDKGMIEAYLEVPLPANWSEHSLTERRTYVSRMMRDAEGKEPGRGTVHRSRVCVEEICVECFGLSEQHAKRAMRVNIADLMDTMEGWERMSAARFGPYGVQRGWRKIDEQRSSSPRT